MVVNPVYVFAPPSVHVPSPCLVSVPVVVPKMLDNVPLYAPPSVNPYVAPVIVPALLIVISPDVAIILLALPRVINPPNVAAVALEFIIAPPFEIPVPFKVSGSAVE